MSQSEIQQGSPEWFALKCGKFSASRAADLMAKERGGAPSTSRANLIATLAVERMNGQANEAPYSNAAMDRGTALEPEARAAYSVKTLKAVETIAFVAHPTIQNVGCSPDGLVGDEGLVEIKCPSAMDRHMQALLTGAHAVEHRLQVQFQMCVTGRKWCDVVSYDPRYPAGLHLAIVRVHRDETTINDIVGAIAVAEVEVAAIIRELNALQELAAQ